MRFNLSSRPILNNMSGERSLLPKKWQSYGKIAIFTLKSRKNINLSTFIYVDFFRFMPILFDNFLVFSDFFQCRFWEFQGGIGKNWHKSEKVCPPPPILTIRRVQCDLKSAIKIVFKIPYQYTVSSREQRYLAYCRVQKYIDPTLKLNIFSTAVVRGNHLKNLEGILYYCRVIGDLTRPIYFCLCAAYTLNRVFMLPFKPCAIVDMESCLVDTYYVTFCRFSKNDQKCARYYGLRCTPGGARPGHGTKMPPAGPWRDLSLGPSTFSLFFFFSFFFFSFFFFFFLSPGWSGRWDFFPSLAGTFTLVELRLSQLLPLFLFSPSHSS